MGNTATNTKGMRIIVNIYLKSEFYQTRKSEWMDFLIYATYKS